MAKKTKHRKFKKEGIDALLADISKSMNWHCSCKRRGTCNCCLFKKRIRTILLPIEHAKQKSQKSRGRIL